MKTRLIYLAILALAVAGCAVVGHKSKPTPPPPPMPQLSAKAAAREATVPKRATFAETHSTFASLLPAAVSDSGDFLITTQTPPTKLVIPGLPPSYTFGMCVRVPTNATYKFQVATNPSGPFLDRGGFTANNGETNCFKVPLTASEFTNRIFVRVRLVPPNTAFIDSTNIPVIRPMGWVAGGQAFRYATGYVNGLLPADRFHR